MVSACSSAMESVGLGPSGKTTLNYHRLVLCEVTADVMAICFQILGIRTVEKM